MMVIFCLVNFILALDLLSKMLERNPERRITASQALKHRFFKYESQRVLHDFMETPIDDPKLNSTFYQSGP